MSFQRQGFFNLPPVVKTLLIINIILFVVKMLMPEVGMKLAVYSFKSDFFEPYQLVTHMFMHGSFWHLLFNMFALYMFGKILEEIWGPKRFLIFYFFTGLGAAAIHLLVVGIQINSMISQMFPDQVEMVLNDGANVLLQGKNYVDIDMRDLNILINTPTVGASGAIFGLLTAFGMSFPNAQLQLLFPPIPIKGKYIAVVALVIGYVMDGSGNVAHFAHLGGIIFGFIFFLIWNKWKFNRWN
ncbi:MAG: rhomboid family intramembrane serine protease [Bacteroidales bacterium]|nr:rhomboid family intramembrane serine protease [Bacteroidales bacterium]MDD3860573.1 rhomboid family intramembrane serine protease [Bacteroidales bacterium]